MAAVMIGVDPHKASHTAVAIGASEETLAELRVRASESQTERLRAWAQAWPERTWAVDGSGGVGHLLAQQLLAAGERVLDVPPKLAARVRLLQAGDTNKNDPNDAFSVAVAALRSPGVREAGRDDHAMVLKIWSKRYKDLGGTRTQVAGPSLAGLFGVGPVITAAVIGDVRIVSRFPNRDHFAACNGTAPIEVSSGGRKVYRLSRRGNRRLNHAIHMAAVTQIRYRHSPGRAYYDKKLAEGKTPKEALRCLKRQISDAIYACLQADARRAAGAKSPGGQRGNDSLTSAAGSHPQHRLFGQATPGPATNPTTPADAAADPASAAFPAWPPSRASGRAGPGPGKARPRSGARRASLTQPPASR